MRSNRQETGVGSDSLSLGGLTVSTLEPLPPYLVRESKIRDVISKHSGEILVFGVGVNSQPQHATRYTPEQMNPLAHAAEARALPMAERSDVVVLSGQADRDYVHWLNKHGLGPGVILEYPDASPSTALADIIRSNPNPMLEVIRDEAAVYIPFYSGTPENALARDLGLELFGSQSHVSRHFFNKQVFKEECESLRIRTVPGEYVRLEPESNGLTPKQLEEKLLNMLRFFPKVIARGSEGAMGNSVYTFSSPTEVREVLQRIRANNEHDLLLEECFTLVDSPNDQWAISRDREIHHLGLTAQVFNGLHHRGNVKGAHYALEVEQYILNTSATIVERMRDMGYVGVLGIDYIVTDQGGIYPIENNARLNGSTFTYGIADRLEKEIGPIPHWKFYRTENGAMSFEQLESMLDDLLYDGINKNAVFPFACQTLRIDGRWSPLLIGDTAEEVAELERRLTQKGFGPV